MSKEIYIHSTRKLENKCFFCRKYANYSLYLAGAVKELCAEHYNKAGVKTEVGT